MNDDSNPYQAPANGASVAVENHISGELATRGNRFCAAFVDGLINCIFVWGIMYFVFSVNPFKPEQPLSVMNTVLLTAAGFIFYLAIHGKFLASNGQTLGKVMAKIKIVNVDGSKPSLSRILKLRLLPIWIVSLIPVVGGILACVETLFIFRSDRRCVHDLIAGTKVVKV